LSIKNGKEPLDMTGIHPEIHKQVYAFIEGELGIKKKDLKLPLDTISHNVSGRDGS
jgi:transcriptional accessory protein Tex/SPT6